MELLVLDEYSKGNIPHDEVIINSFYIANSRIEEHDNICCSISGGSDSDIMLDILHRVDENKKVRYVFFDTGLEYQATKQHLKDLEKKYNIKIEIIKAKVPIPTSCKKYGQPFLSKQVSEWISRLQRHNFKWEDKSFEELYKEYPKCKSSLKWWCNLYGEGSRFNIAYNKGLKEFMISDTPAFKISPKCCKGAKKEPIHNYIKNNNIDLNCFGVRKAEGGTRSTAYKNCFTENKEGADNYRPIFWYKDLTKITYETFYKILHSDCYRKYGLKRTGCCGCPYGNDFENELRIMQKYEPKLYVAVNNIFKDSYEYTRKYKEFVKSNYSTRKEIDGQLSMF